MLKHLKVLLRFLSTTPLHPQWLANKYHKAKLDYLRLLNDKLLLDIGSGRMTLKGIVNSSNTVFTSDYPTTSEFYQNKPHIFLDAKSLPISDASLDVIICYEVLEHIDFSEKVISEFARVIKPGGDVYVSVPFLYPEHDTPHDYFRFTLYGLTQLLARHGFSVTHSLKLGEGIDGILLLGNMYLLLMARRLESAIGIFVLPVAGIFYFICLLNNFLSLLLKIVFPNVKEFYLGVSVVAKKK